MNKGQEYGCELLTAMTVQKLFDDKFAKMESRIENNLIERKLDEKMNAIVTSNETNAQQSNNKNVNHRASW